MQAIRAPLVYAARSSTARERLRDLRETLGAALERAAQLEIPPEAQRILQRSADALGRCESLEVALPALEQSLAPLLEDAYPLRVLGLATERVPGIGPKTAAALERKEIRTVEDLLFFLPRSYEDRRRLCKVEELQVGHPACFEARVTRAGVVPLRSGRRYFQAVVADETGAVQLKWFRGIAHFRDRLRPGCRVLVSGDVRRYRFAKELYHPEIDIVSDEAPLESLPRIVPVYASVEGVPPRTVRRLVESVVGYASDLVDAALPEDFVKERALPDLGESLRQVHLPGVHLDPDELGGRRTPYHMRLIAEELFLLQAGLALRREGRAQRRTEPLAVDDPRVARALAGLPFELTSDQKAAWAEIKQDLGRPHPMNRLLVGDVGTGKTVLALLAAVAAHASGGLTAVLAPTEILAEQHYATLRRLAEPVDLRVALLTGSTAAPERRSLARLLRLGEVGIAIGTHALLAEGLSLPNLRLVVIDEQHRFGVVQRQVMRRKGAAPHVLVMTATPIPRTLALTLYGDLEQSVLRERPAGRGPVQTSVVPPSAARSVLQEVRRRVARGEQVYVVYPLVEESEKQDLLDATRGFERLCRNLPGVELSLLHGRLDARERSRAMARFAAGEVKVLVSTTVIEVGVDVPNATLLVVQHAERFGLAQLHQLRGRVGRGSRPGRAILIGAPRTEEASRRLAVLEASDSGFDIADEDLRIRGPGEWLGTRQAGHLPELRIADLLRHGELLDPVRAAAARLLRADPGLEGHPWLRRAIERRWGGRLELGAEA
jgi:ATP-dependent DNA helicase RecG